MLTAPVWIGIELKEAWEMVPKIMIRAQDVEVPYIYYPSESRKQRQTCVNSCLAADLVCGVDSGAKAPR